MLGMAYPFLGSGAVLASWRPPSSRAGEFVEDDDSEPSPTRAETAGAARMSLVPEENDDDRMGSRENENGVRSAVGRES